MRKKFFFLGILLGVCLASPAQFYSARTNLIGLATGNINLEGSMTLNRRWSLHLPVQYNPFVFKDNRQFRIRNCKTITKTTQTGLEPVTSAVTGRRSNQLSHQAKSGRSGTRTRDRSVMSRLL